MLRERIKQVADEFPEEVDIDAFMERIYLLHHLELAEKQIAECHFFTQEEMEEKVKSWRK